VRLLLGDQEPELKSVRAAESRKLPRSRLGDEQVHAFERTAEDAVRVALRGRRSSSPGPGEAPLECKSTRSDLPFEPKAARR
jgi:hypothetical protein